VQAEAFTQWCASRRASNVRRGHRQLIVLSGEQRWAEALLSAAINGEDGVLLVAHDALAGFQPSGKAASLGIESDWVIIDGHRYSSVNHWLAAAGTLRGGGSLVLLTPPLADWPQAYASAMQEAGFAVEHSVFISRLTTLLPLQPEVYLIQQGSESAQVSHTAPINGDKAHAWRAEVPSADQLSTVAAIVRAARGRSGRPLVIRADRGRGKTSALGIAAAELLRSGSQKVVISAARADMVEIAFRRAMDVLPGAVRDDNSLVWQGAVLEYLTPADLLSASACEDFRAELVMVDEAAHLPLPLLETLLVRLPRLVFSTTVSGYEGTGRGFDIRFRRCLDRLRPQWRRQFLSTPLRWADDDPLEAALNTIFLLRATEAAPDAGNGRLRVDSVSAAALVNDDLALGQVFQLLMEAHYQTTPQDLQYLLDLPSQLIIARIGTAIVGVCQALPEGALADEQCERVSRGQRRIKGHLLAQTLAQRSGQTQWLVAPSLRINRIAVSEGQRRRGIASALLAELLRNARGSGCAYLSSSFSCEPELLAFWRRQGFAAVHLASRRDTSSGSYSLMVVRPLSDNWPHLDAQREVLCNELLSCTELLRRDMPAPALAALLAALPVQGTEYDRQQQKRYVAGELPFEQAAVHLKRVCVGAAPSPSALVVERLYQSRDWAALAAAYRLTGRADCERQLKQYFAGVDTGDDQQE
jgi:tRNA(Met) cytidine acetyltransferase